MNNNNARYNQKLVSAQNNTDNQQEYPVLKPIVPQVFGIPDNLCAIT
jgi:hypothetical protein